MVNLLLILKNSQKFKNLFNILDIARSYEKVQLSIIFINVLKKFSEINNKNK